MASALSIAAIGTSPTDNRQHRLLALASNHVLDGKLFKAKLMHSPDHSACNSLLTVCPTWTIEGGLQHVTGVLGH
jgi:hypothetical protein